MKKFTIYFSCLLLSVLMANVTYAQDSGNPRPLTDKTVGDNLNKDWGQRNPGTQNSVQWYDAGDGYYGTYNDGDTPYMTFYDKDGGYAQTYKKGDWNTVTPSLKSSFDNSTYKNQEVTGFWESSDPSQKGYYLEVRDNTGKSSRVWSNEKGEMSQNFPKGKSTASR